MGAQARPIWKADSPDERTQLWFRAHLGEQTLDQLQEAQKQALKAATPLVHPLVWAEALKLAEGDRSRIMIHGPYEVHVVNNPSELPPWLVDNTEDY